MLELSCTNWLYVFGVVALITWLVALGARIKKTGLNSSNTSYVGKYPPYDEN